MLDIGWTELVVIAIVLIVVVGPKDLPPMLRAFGRMTGRMRGMASDFRRQFDEALREADLDEVRKTISDAQSLNPTTALRDAMNPLRQLGNEIKSDLQRATTPDAPAQPVAPEAPVTPAPQIEPATAPAGMPAKPVETVAAAAVGSASRQMQRAAADEVKVAESKAPEATPKRAAKPRAASQKAASAKGPAIKAATKKAAATAAPKKAATRKTTADDRVAPVGTEKTSASARKKKGDA
ncbi:MULTISPECIES: Sec-independent protein translocase protein TatB [Sinorhizobium]|uniref:Sec-independent protein translocase protein TatB n=1 Tax=Sinorhizobium americanum TaxID=194963 RepID=A0A2S3YVW1_9HYPH|nr:MULTISPECIES: Sec-independent protein translocase protein TatB [Sinorhizobium]PDT39843.1 twin-arginine translocase subunit TatB [Sinorhizobium sp. FG01]POH35763.1 preprotein translocase [Sinorhizobium americanum]